MASKLTPEQREELTEALAQLKASEASHWDVSGYAKLAVVTKLAGFPVTRDMVQEVAPTLTRTSVGKANPEDDDSWMEEKAPDGADESASMASSKPKAEVNAPMPTLPDAPVVAKQNLGAAPTPKHDDTVAAPDAKAYQDLMDKIGKDQALIDSNRNTIAQKQEENRRAEIRLAESLALKNQKFPPISPAEMIRRANQRNHEERLLRAQSAEKMRALTGGMSMNPAAPVDAHPPKRAQGK